MSVGTLTDNGIANTNKCGQRSKNGKRLSRFKKQDKTYLCARNNSVRQCFACR